MQTAAVVIATKNRRDDLRRALKSAFAQVPAVEVLVLDDGSTDGTSEMVRSEFPAARIDRVEQSLGCVVQRNRAASLTEADILVSIDDDAEFSSPYVVAQAVAEFSDTRVGAVAIPYIEPHKAATEFQRAPTRDQIWVTDSFRGTAYAVARRVFLSAGRFRSEIMHQGEESDLAIRLFNEAWVIRLGNGDPIIHYESPNRDMRKMDFYGRRNDVLFAWRNVPLPYAIAHILATTANGLKWAWRAKSKPMLRGIASGYRGIFAEKRNPVSRHAYRLQRQLKKRGAKRLSEIFLPVPRWKG